LSSAHCEAVIIGIHRCEKTTHLEVLVSIVAVEGQHVECTTKRAARITQGTRGMDVLTQGRHRRRGKVLKKLFIAGSTVSHAEEWKVLFVVFGVRKTVH
jgi:hypothetical protein